MEVKLENCEKNYLKNNRSIKVLNKINYTFSNNKFYAIMGESGSGKSTLINILTGLLKYDAGSIYFDNKLVKSDKDFTNLRRNNLSIIYQSYLLNENMTALENVMLPLYLNKSLTNDERKEIAINKLKELGLESRINHYPKELSGGEQQRVAIARALINNPEIILADEPTGNLDKENEKYIFELLKKLSQENKCVIIVSHNEEIKKYADKVLYIKDGELHEE